MSATDVVDATESTAKGGKGKLLMIVGVLVLLLGAGAAWFFVFAPDAEAEEGEAELVEGEIVTLEPQTTTLGEAQLNHARVSLAVVLAEGVDPAVVPLRAALLQDALLTELAMMDADSIRSAEGSAELRRLLTEDAREIWEEGEVVRVVLTELLVQ